MEKEQIAQLERRVIWNLKADSIGCGWCAAWVLFTIPHIIDGNVWGVIAFAVNAACCAHLYRRAFGQKGEKRFTVNLYDKEGKKLN